MVLIFQFHSVGPWVLFSSLFLLLLCIGTMSYLAPTKTNIFHPDRNIRPQIKKDLVVVKVERSKLKWVHQHQHHSLFLSLFSTENELHQISLPSHTNPIHSKPSNSQIPFQITITQTQEERCICHMDGLR